MKLAREENTNLILVEDCEYCKEPHKLKFRVVDVYEGNKIYMITCPKEDQIILFDLSSLPLSKPFYSMLVDGVFNFGKYEGRSIEWILEKDSSYILWAENNIKTFVCPPEVLKQYFDIEEKHAENIREFNEKKGREKKERQKFLKESYNMENTDFYINTKDSYSGIGPSWDDIGTDYDETAGGP